MKNVEGLGYAGDVLPVDRSLFRRILEPTKQAIYASEENIKNTEKIREVFKKQQNFELQISFL